VRKLEDQIRITKETGTVGDFEEGEKNNMNAKIKRGNERAFHPGAVTGASEGEKDQLDIESRSKNEKTRGGKTTTESSKGQMGVHDCVAIS